ncbi:hypothetical protein PtoMrB4_51700 [Metapseudomonas otitidis]|uniref:Uncharacterized protein n=1 Tax=Metapseudomonas otitidis TaxID=319939 RepID=A0A679GK35_9GAMM|nr:hypothetical protein PtoMrB4_51700 [Pseudomonas otitidis]
MTGEQGRNKDFVVVTGGIRHVQDLCLEAAELSGAVDRCLIGRFLGAGDRDYECHPEAARQLARGKLLVPTRTPAMMGFAQLSPSYGGQHMSDAPGVWAGCGLPD